MTILQTMNCLTLILSLVICAYQRVTGTPTNATLSPTEYEIHESAGQSDYLSRLMTMMGPFKESFLGFTKGTHVTNEDLLNYRRVNTFFYKEATDALKERFQIVRFRDGEFESINQRDVYLKYIRSLVTSDDAEFRGKDFLNGIYLHNTTKLKTQWTPQMAIVVGENNLRFTDRDSSHCRIVNIKNYHSFGQYIEFGSDEFCATEAFAEVPEGDGVLIPKMFGAYVDYITITEKRGNLYKIEPPVKVFQPDVKLILMMHNGGFVCPLSMTHDLLNSMCTLKYVKIFHISYDIRLNNRDIYQPASSLIVFRGKGIIYAHFHISYSTDEHLKLKLREWKDTISFLKSHQIIAFQMRRSTMVPDRSEIVFNEVFGIWPISLCSFCGCGFTECSNIKPIFTFYAMTNFILIGFREISDSQHLLHSEELKKPLEDTETSAKEARYE